MGAHATSQPARLDQHDLDARLRQQQSSRDADDPAADHDHFGAGIVLERRMLRLLGAGGDPERRMPRHDVEPKPVSIAPRLPRRTRAKTAA
jgi:hypothetical protein